MLGLARCCSGLRLDLFLEEAGGGSDGSDSLTWKWFRMRHELDHQLYLVLAAMTFWVRTALWTNGGAVSWVI